MAIKGTVWLNFPKKSKLNLLLKMNLKKQLQFATNRIKIRPLEPEIQPIKGARLATRWDDDVT